MVHIGWEWRIRQRCFGFSGQFPVEGRVRIRRDFSHPPRRRQTHTAQTAQSRSHHGNNDSAGLPYRSALPAQPRILPIRRVGPGRQSQRRLPLLEKTCPCGSEWPINPARSAQPMLPHHPPRTDPRPPVKRGTVCDVPGRSESPSGWEPWPSPRPSPSAEPKPMLPSPPKSRRPRRSSNRFPKIRTIRPSKPVRSIGID